MKALFILIVSFGFTAHANNASCSAQTQNKLEANTNPSTDSKVRKVGPRNTVKVRSNR